MLQHFRILSTGIYLPSHLVTDADMDCLLGCSPGWTSRHSQVLQRYHCLPPETIATMAGNAARSALANAQLPVEAIDLIIDCSTSLYQPIPCNAAIYQAQLGKAASGIPCVDIHGTCLGFVLALNMVNGLMATGAYQRILLLVSEGALSGVNWQEPESAALMSDGAAAVIVERQQPTDGFLFEHQTFSEFAHACEVRSGGHRCGPFEYKPEAEADYRFHMNGPLLFRIAKQRLPPMVERLFDAASVPRDSIHIVPHQASPLAVESIRRLIRHPAARYYNRCAQLGNMVAASIPVVLHQVLSESRIQRGEVMMLLGTSAGYSQAACILRF